MHDPSRVTHELPSGMVYIRELGYFEVHDINQAATAASKDGRSFGMALSFELALAACEGKDGAPAFTRDSLRKLPKAQAEPLLLAVMRAQGYSESDSDDKGEEAPGNP